jgi:hypothetical protein
MLMETQVAHLSSDKFNVCQSFMIIEACILIMAIVDRPVYVENDQDPFDLSDTSFRRDRWDECLSP